MKTDIDSANCIKASNCYVSANHKHAYLIIAHNQFELLKILCSLLDDYHNDFYILIDKKSRAFDEKTIRDSVKKSDIYFVDRINITWGDFSLIQAEINLLKAAFQKKYSFYHLLSGVDLPLKTSAEIYDFFESHTETEFIHYANKDITFSNYVQDRAKYYYRHNKKFSSLRRFSKMSKIDLRLQSILKIDRKRKYGKPFYYGSNWFSITNECAEYILSQTKWIKKHFSFSFATDEIFLQTLVYNSKFKDRLYIPQLCDNHLGCMRAIDFNRGCPYTYRIEDFDELINSNYLFARKFNLNIDSEICYKIKDYIENKNK